MLASPVLVRRGTLAKGLHGTTAWIARQFPARQRGERRREWRWRPAPDRRTIDIHWAGADTGLALPRLGRYTSPGRPPPRIVACKGTSFEPLQQSANRARRFLGGWLSGRTRVEGNPRFQYHTACKRLHQKRATCPPILTKSSPATAAVGNDSRSCRECATSPSPFTHTPANPCAG